MKKLYWRQVIKIGGEDKNSFLQGLITNDINNCTDDDSIFSLMLTPQGKFLFDMHIYKDDDSYLLDINAETADKLIKKLNIYKLRSKVDIATTNLCALWNGGKRMIGGNTDNIDINEYNHYRVENSIVDPHIDMESGADFPLQYNMEQQNAINYQKGCYVGQEVTARSKYRGNIRKQIKIITGDNLCFGQDIIQDDKKLGKVLTVSNNKALAIIDISRWNENTSYQTKDSA